MRTNWNGLNSTQISWKSGYITLNNLLTTISLLNQLSSPAHLKKEIDKPTFSWKLLAILTPAKGSLKHQSIILTLLPSTNFVMVLITLLSLFAPFQAMSMEALPNILGDQQNTLNHSMIAVEMHAPFRSTWGRSGFLRVTKSWFLAVNTSAPTSART